MAEAAHVAKNHGDGSTHTVGFGDLRVMLIQEDGVWYAQGMDVDYISEGRTQEEAMKSFERGLALTIQANLEHSGNILDILQSADSDIWKEFLEKESGQFLFSYVRRHQLKEQCEEGSMWAVTDDEMEAMSHLPFGAISYVSPTKAA